MARQVHGVMKQPQDFDHLTPLVLTDAKHHEVTPLAATASDMQREDSLGDIVTDLGAENRRARGQRLQCRGERVGIDPRLRLAEPSRRPVQDVLEIGLRCGRQADWPRARVRAVTWRDSRNLALLLPC